MPNPILMTGVVGSKAYGLDTPTSDTDTMSVFLAPTRSFLGINPAGRSSDVHHDPTGDDSTSHELGKFLALVAKSNPTASELLWLDEDLYLVRSPVADQLIEMRHLFLSAKGVKNAYCGYAASQVHRVQREFATPGRQEKAARHTWRLLDQGLQLWRTGTMTLKVDRDACFEFGRRVAAGDTDLLTSHFAACEHAFETEPTVLPNSNAKGLRLADEILVAARIAQLDRERNHD